MGCEKPRSDHERPWPAAVGTHDATRLIRCL